MTAIPHKETVRTVSTTNLTLSGTQTVNGVALVAGDRCLVAAQTTPASNGIYRVAAGAWTRAYDASSSGIVFAGHMVSVSEGTYANSVWQCTTKATITLGTTGLTYTRVAPTYADLSLNPWDPSLLGDNIEREGAFGVLAQTSGTLYLHGGMVLRAGVTYSALNFFYTSASSGLTHSWAGLVLQAAAAIVEGAGASTNRAVNTLVGVSTDNTGAISANTWRLHTFGSTVTPQQDVPVWFAHCLVASTTVPSIAAAATYPTAFLSQAPVLVGTSNTAQTTPLAVNTVVTAPTASAALGYAYLT